MNRILVTGANGFVGHAVCARLLEHGHEVWGLVRRRDSCVPGVRECVIEGDDFARVHDAWPRAVQFDGLIHLAARVHVMRDVATDPLAAYRTTNVAGTMRLANAAAAAGVRRFVFLSSVKALGEKEPGRAWRESDVPAPDDAYGISKLEAERALQSFCESPDAGGMQWSIVRAPLVYGPGVKANFLRLMRAVDHGIPLPVGRAVAPRSLVYRVNLADALMACAFDPRAAGQVFHVTDGEDLGVHTLVAHLSRLLGRPARSLPVPIALLSVLGKAVGRRDEIDRLVTPLRLDIGKVRASLGWTPPLSVEDGLLATANWFRGRA